METNNLTNILEGLSFLRLKEGYLIKPFDCEDEDLNEFLFEKAISYRKELLASTFIIENDRRTLGYYSILSDSFRVEEALFASKSQFQKFRKRLSHPKRHLKSIPAVKIGRLAIDKTFKGKGLGSVIMANIISKCIKMNEEQACRLITVDAYKQAVPFYQKMGFKFLIEGDKDDTTRLMFLDLTSFI